MVANEPREALIPVYFGGSTRNTEDREKTNTQIINHTTKKREGFTWFTTKDYVHG